MIAPTGNFRHNGPMPGFRLLLLLLALCAMPAVAAMRGEPLVQHYRAIDLPVGPAYNAIAADARGTLYAGSDEGVLAFRSGAWEAVDLPRKAIVNSLLPASNGILYVGGPDLIGELRTEDDGSLRFVDLQAKFDGGGKLADNFAVTWIVETSRGVYFRTDTGLVLLRHDGSVQRWPLPPTARELLFAVGDTVYIRLEGVGLCRVEDGVPVPVPGAEAFSHRRFTTVHPRENGLLLLGEDGFYAGDALGVHRLATDADAAFAAHPPYVSLRLPDDSLVVGGLDGMLMHFSSDLKLLDQVDLGAGSVLALGLDREGGLWAAAAQGLARLRLPPPWTAYTLTEKFGNRIYDSAWYDGKLWLATDGDVVSAAAVVPGEAPKFVPQHWTGDIEAFALEATDAGLLVGEHEGLLVLDPGASVPRHMIDDSGLQVSRLLRSHFDPQHVLGLGQKEAFWLVEREGRWDVANRWNLQGATPNGIAETAAGEVWLGDARGGAERWRFDASGKLTERRRFGTTDGLQVDHESGTHLFRLDDVLYMVTGDLVQRFDGDRFVPAQLPDLPGLARPMELENVDTDLGTFVWTLRQIWQRRVGAAGFRPLQLGTGLTPGYRSVKLQDDGQLRLATWESLLQFDPGVADPELPPLRARLDRIALRSPDHPLAPLPLASAQVPVLPPMSGLELRFGLDTMENNPEFRYRMLGYNNDWSTWSDDRILRFRRLPPGDFTLELQARTRSGRSAQMLSYPLRVEAAWYEQAWMLALFALAALLLFAGLIWGIVQWRYRQVLARNRELEQRISERTAELELANGKLAELAARDGLTGVANRRTMEQVLTREWERCREAGEPLSVVMVDVDHFKQFNDLHGHQQGDAQLCLVAQALDDEVVASRELVARYGGEEFALILPGLSLQMATARAESVRRRAEQVTLAGGMRSTVSLGVAACVPSLGTEPTELLRSADAALYRAKRSGRNRVEVAT